MTLGETVTLVTGGPILTMTEKGRAEALLMRGSRIVAVGDLQSCRDSVTRIHETVDLKGRCLMPGFVDAHTHPLMTGQVRGWIDCSPARVSGLEEIVAVMGAAGAKLPPGAWIRGFGYEHRRLVELRHPDSRDLDRVALDRPVLLMNASGHGIAVNSLAMRQLGIDASTPEPPGGQIVRDGSGNPTGLFWDSACDLLTGVGGIKVTNHGPNFHLDDDFAQLGQSFLIAQREFLQAGITTVGDMQVTSREMQTYLAVKADGLLHLRVGMYFLSSELDKLLSLGICSSFGDENLRIQGVKFYADGSLGAWTAYFSEGYLPDHCNHGHLYHDEREFEALIEVAVGAGFQTATHAQSPEAIQLVLNALGRLPERYGVRGGRHRIEHCGLPLDDQILEMARLGIVPVAQPQHHLQFGDGVVAAIGALGQRYNPLGLFERAGIPVVLSSDSPVATPNPLEAIRAARERLSSSGQSLGGEELKVSTLTALRGYTSGAAFALGVEDNVGTLTPGKFADFAIFEHEPFIGDSLDSPTPPVCETWIGGNRVL